MSIGIFIIALLILAALVTIVLALLVMKPRLGLIALAVLVCVITGVFLLWKPIYKTRLPRFAGAVKEVLDPHDLQKWAMLTLSKSSADSSELPLKAVPQPLQALRFDGCKIEYAFYAIDPTSKDSYLVLMWGGGFGHWGLDVGAPSFKEPDDDNFYIKWAPGIYFWEETK